MGKRRYRNHGGNWWTASTGGMVHWLAVGIVGVVAVTLIGTATYAANRALSDSDTALPRPVPSYTFGTEPACVPGDEHLARTAAAVANGEVVRIAGLGDSTRDESAAAPALYDALRDEFPRAEVNSFGRNGATLTRYAADEDLQSEIRAYAPAMIELSIGINDLRQGRSDGGQLADALTSYVEQLHADLPDTDILLSVPAALSTVNVGDADYVTDADGTVNPDGMAQAVTEQLRSAYLTTSERLGYVALLDVQQEVTGTSADTSATPRYTSDQIHPNEATARAIAALIRDRVGSICA